MSSLSFVNDPQSIKISINSSYEQIDMIVIGDLLLNTSPQKYKPQNMTPRHSADAEQNWGVDDVAIHNVTQIRNLRKLF